MLFSQTEFIYKKKSLIKSVGRNTLSLSESVKTVGRNTLNLPESVKITTSTSFLFNVNTSISLDNF